MTQKDFISELLEEIAGQVFNGIHIVVDVILMEHDGAAVVCTGCCNGASVLHMLNGNNIEWDDAIPIQ